MPSSGEMPPQAEGQSSVHAPDEDIVVIDEETAVKEPGLASPPAGRQAGAMPATGTSPAGATSPTPAREPRPATSAGAGDRDAVPLAPGADRRWREIQAMFVDEPRASVQRAADLVDTVIEELIAPIRRRQAALASSWQGRDTDTEALRVALKGYRAFWTVVRDIPPMMGAASGAGPGRLASGAGAGPGPGAGSRTAYGAGPGSASGASPGTGPVTGPGAGSHAAYGAGPGSASGASPGTGPVPGPGAGPGSGSGANDPGRGSEPG